LVFVFKNTLKSKLKKSKKTKKGEKSIMTSAAPGIFSYLQNLSDLDPIYALQNRPYPFLNIIRKIRNYIIEYNPSPNSFHLDPDLFFLDICLCPKLNGPLRFQLEDSCIQLLNISHHNKNEPMTVVSVGPGKCYQELIYVAKLVNQKYEKINLILIDPNMRVLLLSAKLNSFCQHHFKGTSAVTITYCESLESYVKRFNTENLSQDQRTSLMPDLLLLLDLTDKEFQVNGLPLPEYAYGLFRGNALLKNGITVIAHSAYEAQHYPKPHPIVTACVYNRECEKLSDLVDDRTIEFSSPPSAIEPTTEPNIGYTEKEHRKTI
jgi:hypothetical protein